MELKDYLRPLRKWWWLIVLATLIATVSAYFATRQQPPVYRTRTTLMVGTAIENPNPNGNEFWLTQQLANTYADIVKRDNVRAGVMQRLNLTFLPDYAARVVPNTQLIELTVTDIHPLRAQQVAQALAEELINISPAGPGGEDQQRQAFISGQLNDLEAKIQETQAEVDKKQAELANLFSARQIADAQTQLAALQNKKATLQANYAALLSNTQRGALNSISIIEPAALNPQPVGPNRRASILLAAAIGALLAVAAAFLLDYLDDTLKNPDDIQKSLGLTTLGATPRLDGKAGELVALASSQSAATEAYRVLRTNLQFAAVERPIRTLLVTSPSPGEGKSLTAANLAVALAQAGRRVILVDADLRKPRVHRLLNLKNNTGLTTALIQEPAEFDALAERGLAQPGLLQPGPEEGLLVLTSGPLPPNPAELLGSGRARDLIAHLARHADIVVFDSPPVTALSDAVILGAQVDGALLVVEAGRTRRDMARRALEALRKVNARVVGVALNRMPVNREGYNYYYYYQHTDEYTYGPNGKSNGKSNGNGRERKRKERDAAPAS